VEDLRKYERCEVERKEGDTEIGKTNRRTEREIIREELWQGVGSHT
jgi:hypothetical protein